MSELRDLEAEREYLRGLVHLHGRMRHRVPPADLWDPRHQTIARAVVEMQGEQEPVNHVQLVRHLERSGTMREAGDAYVAELLAKRPDAFSLPSIASRIRELAVQRRLREQLTKAAAVAERSVPEARRIAHEAVEQAEAGVDGVRAMTLGEAGEAYWQRVTDASGDNHAATAVRTGFVHVDAAMGALMAGSMTVIGGYQGTRKSSLMLGMSMSMADLDFRPGIITVEDPASLWGARAMNRESGVSSDVTAALLAGQHTDHSNFKQLAASVQELQNRYGNVVVADATRRRTADHVAGCMDTLVHDHGCHAIFVDYLQAFRTDTRTDRRIGVADAAKLLKATASRLGVPLILGSQLSRPENRDQTKEPNVTQLKESGDIENEAENIMLLWLEEKGEKPPTGVRLAKSKLTSQAGKRWRLEVADSGAVAGVSSASETKPSNDAAPWESDRRDFQDDPQAEFQYPRGR